MGYLLTSHPRMGSLVLATHHEFKTMVDLWRLLAVIATCPQFENVFFDDPEKRPNIRFTGKQGNTIWLEYALGIIRVLSENSPEELEEVVGVLNRLDGDCSSAPRLEGDSSGLKRGYFSVPHHWFEQVILAGHHGYGCVVERTRLLAELSLSAKVTHGPGNYPSDIRIEFACANGRRILLEHMSGFLRFVDKADLEYLGEVLDELNAVARGIC